MARAAQRKKDSLQYYLYVTASVVQGTQTQSQALEKLEYATKFVVSHDDSILIGKARSHIMAAEIFAQVKRGSFAQALPALNEMLTADMTNIELLYQRAICYSYTGHTAEAVQDLAPLLAAGNEDAIKLHDKINPLTKHVAYYTTRCRDDSYSSAKGIDLKDKTADSAENVFAYGQACIFERKFVKSGA